MILCRVIAHVRDLVDLDQALAALQDRGYVRDPFGRLINILQHE